MPAGPPVATPASLTTPTSVSTSQTVRDGRTVRLVGLGERTAPLLHRISAQLDDAADAVSAFWGPDWPREIVVVAAGTDAQFAAVGGGDSHTAATTTGERIMFAPGAARLSDASLRIVLRHELFHYAARADTAADAPRWLTEGVADFVGRPQTPLPANAAVMTAARTPHRRRVERTRTLAGLRPSLVVQPVRGRGVRHRGPAVAVRPGVRTRPPRPGRRGAGHPRNRPRRTAGRMAAVAYRLA